tara:strand:- start:15 stop:185 length:171 start_codon:yes stop_codon:yes gene_type:complete
MKRKRKETKKVLTHFIRFIQIYKSVYNQTFWHSRLKKIVCARDFMVIDIPLGGFVI